jgi:predicted Zn finger-like uncharacterized protein
MYSHCPHCRTLFRIYPEQLAQARGQVRCGVCNYSFNALETLSEHPVWPPAPPSLEDAALSHIESAEQHTPSTSIPAEIHLETEAVVGDAEQDAALGAIAEDIPQHSPFVSMPAEIHPEIAEGDTDIEPGAAMAAVAEENPQDSPSVSSLAEIHPETSEVDADAEPGVAMATVAEEAPQDSPSASSLAEIHPETSEVDADAEPGVAMATVVEEALTTTPIVETEEIHEPIPDTAVQEAVEVTIETPANAESSPSPEQAIEVQANPSESSAPSVSEEEIGTPLPSPMDSTLPDLGIIAAEPRPISTPQLATNGFKTALWAAINIVLILVLLGQYTYYNRNELAQYPDLRPWLATLCEAMSCDTPLQRDVSRIVLTNRIVESHPRHANALLIDATLVNDADFPQPYPLLDIRFSDLNNQLVAGRRFRPSEYLPAGTSLQAGMAPHQPIHITLEIVDPGKDAVSFQFELL